MKRNNPNIIVFDKPSEEDMKLLKEYINQYKGVNLNVKQQRND